MGAATPGKFRMPRRRPVPVEWREEHHRLSVRSHVAGGRVRGSIPYRARGRCSCGTEFNPSVLADGTRSGSDTMDRADVIDAWKDHVEDAYYAAVEKGET